ncbi:hypothetical protein [Caulobacter sp.]|uniref:hypothetical protein n=1 Tax=Caulobacter sp. TaxID=78 RepID=UPI001B28B2C8|nr:hypothetical protein [Caulobacter sp.]MBO9544019.1 hypothetical protein [Caulobacter sp.]
MFLSALALASAIQAVPVAPSAPIAPPGASKPSFNRAIGQPGARSPLECRQRAIKAREDAIARGEPLNRMPGALLHHTVIRMVDGCPVSTQVRQSGPAR